MLGGLKAWFTALSLGRKAVVVGGSLLATTSLGATGTTPPQAREIIQPETSMMEEVEAEPVVEVRKVTETEAVEFETIEVKDSTLKQGKTAFRQRGVNGERTIIYDVTYEDGVERSRKKIASDITVKPVNEIVAIGTYVKPALPPVASRPPRARGRSGCHPNYSGCVPMVSDVDCAGGGGNGPAYVSGPIRVIGEDVYRLDGDDDGTACE